MTVRDIEKYRRRNPAAPIPGLRAYRHCAVIPCYNEDETFGATLASLKNAMDAADFPVAVLAVINYPPGADPAESLRLDARIRAGEFAMPSLFHICAPELKGGVGAARKLGMDTFIHSLEAGEIENAFLYSMDADTAVEKEYFKETAAFFASDPRGGVSIGFRHGRGATPEEESAIRRYENYLDRYVAKLRECNSPYAFHAVGSAFAVRCGAYIRCGGMKVRSAGEDFYFLQELAKTSGTGTIGKVLLHPSPRPSARTPFGTGQAVRRIIAGKGLPEVSDEAFRRLKTLLSAVDEKRLDSEAPALPEAQFLTAEGFFKVWPGIRRNTPSGRRTAAFHVWFDGLKTLRFLHFCDA